LSALLTAALLAFATVSSAQPVPLATTVTAKPVEGETYRTHYVRLGGSGEGLLYEPIGAADPARSRISLVFSHPSGNNLSYSVGPELSHRGYWIVNLNARASADFGSDRQLGAVSEAIAYLRRSAQPSPRRQHFC
jgi:hypothetical protein